MTPNLTPGTVVTDMTKPRFKYDSSLGGWFGPGIPMPPVAPPETAGRLFDYPIGGNFVPTPRANTPFSFQTLRDLSVYWDVARLLIETRKDQLVALPWLIRPKDRKATKHEALCAEITTFMKNPDKQNGWSTWLRKLSEDMLSIDAATVYPRYENGKLFAIDVIDGATIKPVLDQTGRRPRAPLPAFQQILHGMAAVNYTSDELLYYPKNVRANSPYGFSPIEQIVVTVTIAMHRQAYQLQYYTEGTMPDLILSVPEGWTPKQIQEFKQLWDSMLLGNQGKRRGTMFVHNGTEPVNTKDIALKDPFDEWLARVACYAFGISPQPFVSQMNRATAETAETMAKEEGIGPCMLWVREVVTDIIARCFKNDEIEFAWVDQDDVDPETKALIQDKQIRNRTLTRNEARQDNGRDPVEGGDEFDALPTASTDGGLDPNAEEADENATLEKVTRAVVATEGKLRNASTVTLKAVGAQVRKQLVPAYEKAQSETAKASSKARAKTLVDSLDLSKFLRLSGPLATELAKSNAQAYKAAFIQVGQKPGAAGFELANERGTKYAEKRAAKLISGDGNGGELADTTRKELRTLVANALDEGWSREALTSRLVENFLFSPDRADMIAHTEWSIATNQGKFAGWKKSGVVKGKQWLLSSDHDDNEGCMCGDNADEGVIGLEEEFPSGDQMAPAHPRCECSVSPVVGSEDETE